MRSILIVTTVLLFCFAGVLFISFSQKQTVTYAQFDENNNLIRPKGYRSWVFAGTAATPKSHDSTVFFPDFQNVYIDPEGYKYWKEHGAWKEGTIFVKELLRAGDTVSAVGRGFYQGAHYSVSAMVKDSKRFPGMHEGWNYFRFVDAQKHILVEKSPPLGAKCGFCHLPNAIDGNIFYQYYPNILQAKGFGTGDPEDMNTRTGLEPGYKYVRITSEYLKNQTR